MSYLGDYAEDYADLNCKFTTVGTDGAPTTLSGTPAISVYKSNSLTQSTAGITLSVDFDSVTGLNNVNIDLSADAFYVTGEDYQIVITTGTVGGTSVVGYVVGEFSIENRFNDVNVATWLGTAVTTSSTTSKPEVDINSVSDDATAANNLELMYDGTGYAGGTTKIKIDVSDLLTTQMTEAYAADGTAPTLAEALFLVMQSLHEFAISGTTRTVKKLDGITTAATFTLDDASSPTSTTRAT